MFVTQHVATPVHTPALPSSALPCPPLPLPCPILPYLFSDHLFLLFYFFGVSVMIITFTPHPLFPFCHYSNWLELNNNNDDKNNYNSLEVFVHNDAQSGGLVMAYRLMNKTKSCDDTLQSDDI